VRRALFQTAQEMRESRIKDLTAELERLYARYQELEEQKRTLLERLGELARER
jgi:chaperonin cofactor prefoldin